MQAFGNLNAVSGPPPTPFSPNINEEEMRSRMESFRKWHKADRKLGPTKAPIQNRQHLLYSAEDSRNNRTLMERDQGAPTTSATIVGFEIHSSMQSFETLKRISFSDMMIRKVHLGAYLLCRIICLPVRFTALSLIVEDVRGLVNNLTIYNYPTVPDSSTQYVGALFPPGTVLAIREPTFKMPTQGNTPIVRVDSPSDVIFLSPDSPFLRGVSWKSGQVPGTLVTPTTASSWKDLGNRHFKNSWWLPAAYAYSRGLELDPTSWASQSNRAEAYLRLKFYHSAAADAESVLSMGEVPELSRGKALFRLAKAKYGQCDYNVAKVLFEEWNRSNPEHSEGNAWLQRCQLRLSEVEDASYDWLNVLKNSSKELHVDISDFKGPVEVKSRREVDGGRGIFATRDIKCGELLVVSKPFVSVFAQDLPNNLSISLNVLTDTVYSASQSALLSRLAEKMYGNPELHSTVFALHAGPGTTPLTSFDYDPSQRQPLSNPMIPVIDIDIERLERISAFNTFEPNPLTVYGSPKPESKSTKSSAFYIFPSLFNHACLAKASWVCFGDVMVIRACEDATAGSEITLPYVGDPKYSERCRLLKKHFDECDCTLCTEDRTDGDAAIKRRDDIESALLGQVDRYSLDKVRDLSSQVASTYSKSRGPIRPLLAHLHYMTADKLRSLPNKTVANFKEACKEDYKALEASGIKVIDKGTEGPVDASHLPIATNFLPTSSYLPQLVISAMNVSQFFQQVKENNSRATCWLRAALWIQNCVHGGGKSLFLHFWNLHLQRSGFLDFAKQVL